MTTESLPHFIYCTDDPKFLEFFPTYYDAHCRWHELRRRDGYKITYLIGNERRTGIDPGAHITDCNE